MNKLKRKDFIHVSIMLFGLFFGAGNLIFPPLLGNQSGENLWIAFLGFAITAIVFPVVGAIVVGKTEGLTNLASRVGPIFALVFTTAIYISIGPGMGIPRAGSVPFEMAIAPYLPESFSITLARLVYTFVFFTVAMWICLNPSKLVVRVGKYLTPSLLLLITLMFVRVVLLPSNVGQPVGDYANAPLVKGFLSGYETMDAIAALNFGFVIAVSIKRFGIKDKKTVTKYTVKSGLIAGSLLTIVYGMLSLIGMRTSGLLVGAKNGVVILTANVREAFGEFGLVLLAGIFTLACLTTCVGLITSGGEYFHTLFKEKLSYRSWVYIWTIFSFLMANFGLNKLLEFSIPLLSIIYPVALVLIVMGVSHDLLKYGKLSYLLSAIVAVVLPVINVLAINFKISIPFLTNLEKGLPLADKGLSWLLPTLVVLVVAYIVEKLINSEKLKVR